MTKDANAKHLTAKPFTRIVLATDFSEGARKAMRRIIHLPIGENCTITIIHATPKASPLSSFEKLGKLTKSQLQREADKLRKTIPNSRHIQIECKLLNGKPVDEIVHFAKSTKAELVLLGRRGTTAGFKELLLGSVAERVALKAGTAILIVGKPPRKPYQKPLAAIDDDIVSGDVLQHLLRTAPTAEKAKILHVWRLPHEGQMRRARLAEDVIKRDRRKWKAEVETNIKKPVAKFIGSNPTLFLTLHHGDARFEINKVAANMHADLIVLGTLSNPGLKHLVIGSVAQEVLRQADRDVMIVRPLTK